MNDEPTRPPQRRPYDAELTEIYGELQVQLRTALETAKVVQTYAARWHIERALDAVPPKGHRAMTDDVKQWWCSSGHPTQPHLPDDVLLTCGCRAATATDQALRDGGYATRPEP